MNGVTILETVQATEAVINSPVIKGIIISCCIGVVVFLVIGDFWEKFKIISYIITVFLTVIPVFLLCIAEWQMVDLGYEYVIAYVDTDIVTEEQLKTKYEILESNKEILIVYDESVLYDENKDPLGWEYQDPNPNEEMYVLREKEILIDEFLPEDTIQSEHIHNWQVLEVKKDVPYNDFTTYVLSCSNCKEDKLLIRSNTEESLVDL